MIEPCECVCEVMDKLYGTNLRQHAPYNNAIRCTVCGRVKEKQETKG